MAFKLKSGNASAFKNLGSSPAKQVEGNFNKTGGKSTTPGYSTTKAAKANTATGGDPKLEKLKAKRIARTKAGKVVDFGQGSNIIADKVDSQGRNTWGDKVGKAKKVVKKEAKVAKKVAGKAAKAKNLKKNFDAFQSQKQKGKEFVKSLKNSKQILKKGILKGASQVAKRFLGPVGAALTAYDVVKTLPKVAKATNKSLRKEAKTGSYVGKPKY